jgi:hypothetical protein
MTASPIDPFALVNLSMTDAERKHQHTQQIIAQDFAERQFAYKQLTNDRARSDMYYMNVQGRIDAAFAENFAKSMGEMTFGAMDADVRASRAANTPPLLLFNNQGVMPNPQGNQVYESAGPGAADTPPGTIAPSAADRVAGPDTGEPVAASVTPDKPVPGATAPAGTPQQQRIQGVRDRGQQMPQRGGVPQGPDIMPSPKMTINAVHVDPVTGQMYGNIKGHMIPLNKQAWDVIQNWQGNQITAYAAQTRRMNAITAKKAVDSQEELLTLLMEGSNHGLLEQVVDQLPDLPDYVVATLNDAKNKFTSKEYRRYAGEIISAHQSGDGESLQLALREMASVLYDKERKSINDDLKEINRTIDDLENRAKRSNRNEDDRKQAESSLRQAKEQRRILERRLLEQVPVSGSPTISMIDHYNSKSTNALESFTEDAIDSLISTHPSIETRGDFDKAIAREFKREDSSNMPVTNHIADQIQARLQEKGWGHELDEVDWLTLVGMAAGVTADIEKETQHITVPDFDPSNIPLPPQGGLRQPPMPGNQNETGQPYSQRQIELNNRLIKQLEEEKRATLKSEYEKTLQPGEAPNANSWAEFLIKQGYQDPRVPRAVEAGVQPSSPTGQGTWELTP